MFTLVPGKQIKWAIVLGIPKLVITIYTTWTQGVENDCKDFIGVCVCT